MNNFGAAVKRRREALGIEQAELARRMKRTQSTVSYWEAGKTWPRQKLLTKLAAELKCSIAYLVKGGR